jgi:predicted nucleic acid-binding protein
LRRVGVVKTRDAHRRLERLPIDLFPVDQPLVRAAREVRSEHALSHADAFCSATAQALDANVLTDDPEFESIASVV